MSSIKSKVFYEVDHAMQHCFSAVLSLIFSSFGAGNTGTTCYHGSFFSIVLSVFFVDELVPVPCFLPTH